MRSSSSSLATTCARRSPEIITLSRTLSKRAADILAYFNRPGTINGLTEAINGRLAHLRGTSLGSATSPYHCWRPAESGPPATTTPD